VPSEQIIILSLIQGLTEFLPISSSGHLNLLHLLTDWKDQGPLIDVAVHLGSLLAVLIYFRRDVLSLLIGLFKYVKGKKTPEGTLALYMIFASIPLFIAGFILLKTGIINNLRTLEVIAWANIIFAAILWASDSVGITVRRLEHTRWSDAFLIGLSQILALIPGASRSGVTITMARFLGYERPDAARFSMLLSIPAILGAGGAVFLKVFSEGDFELQSSALSAVGLSFLSALASIWFMMSLLERTTLMPFVIYRFVMGAALLAFAYNVL